MSHEVGTTLLGAVEDHGVQPEYATLPDAYREKARTMIRQYATDAAINGLAYDRADERRQVTVYADAVQPPRRDARLPAWVDAPFSAEDVRKASQADVVDVRRV